jgi:hypothetical protein
VSTEELVAKPDWTGDSIYSVAHYDPTDHKGAFVVFLARMRFDVAGSSAVKAQGKLAALGFDMLLTGPNSSAIRITSKQRMVAKLKTIKVGLLRRKHDRISQVGAWLRKVVTGYYQYHAVPGNIDQLRTFRQRVNRLWRNVLVRRSQRAKRRWESLTPVFNRWIPIPRILHPILTPASTPLILHKSRMRRRARTDPSGGRSVMSVPTGTTENGGWIEHFDIVVQSTSFC